MLFTPFRAIMCTTKQTEVHTMKTIPAFENAIANKVKDIRAEGINPTAFWAYRNSCRCENDLIDFNEVIWDEDIEAIAETLDANGITEFTISWK